MKIRKIEFSRQAQDFLLALPAKQCKQHFTAIMTLSQNPQPHNAKKLNGFEKNLYRISVGEYRIVYHFDDETIYIACAGKRNDDEVYARLKRNH